VLYLKFASLIGLFNFVHDFYFTPTLLLVDVLLIHVIVVAEASQRSSLGRFGFGYSLMH